MWKEIRRACRRKHPRPPSVRNIFGDERATAAILTLRDIRVGCMRAIISPEELEAGEEVETIELVPRGVKEVETIKLVPRGVEGGKGGPGPP